MCILFLPWLERGSTLYVGFAKIVLSWKHVYMPCIKM